MITVNLVFELQRFREILMLALELFSAARISETTIMYEKPSYVGNHNGRDINRYDGPSKHSDRSEVCEKHTKGAELTTTDEP